MFHSIRYHPGPEGSGPGLPAARVELASIETRIPRLDSFETGRNQELHHTWRELHSDLYRVFKTIDAPFFSLHGTSRENLQAILVMKQGQFQVATFADKSKEERRLYELYAAIDYCSAYTQRRTPNRGGILVFDSEMRGRNFTGSGETLAYSGILPSGLIFDSHEEERELTRLRGGDAALGRGFLEINRREDFDSRLKGAIDCGDLNAWFQTPAVEGPEFMAKTILKSRFRIQLLACKTLALLAS